MILAADQRSRFWATVTGVLGEKQNRKFGKEAKKLFGGWDLKKGTKKNVVCVMQELLIIARFCVVCQKKKMRGLQGHTLVKQLG